LKGRIRDIYIKDNIGAYVGRVEHVPSRPQVNPCPNNTSNKYYILVTRQEDERKHWLYAGILFFSLSGFGIVLGLRVLGLEFQG
jgi:hypothetical protein